MLVLFKKEAMRPELKPDWDTAIVVLAVCDFIVLFHCMLDIYLETRPIILTFFSLSETWHIREGERDSWWLWHKSPLTAVWDKRKGKGALREKMFVNNLLSFILNCHEKFPSLVFSNSCVQYVFAWRIMQLFVAVFLFERDTGFLCCCFCPLATLFVCLVFLVLVLIVLIFLCT